MINDHTRSLGCFNFSLWYRHMKWGILGGKQNTSNQIEFLQGVSKFSKTPSKFEVIVALFSISCAIQSRTSGNDAGIDYFDALTNAQYRDFKCDSQQKLGCISLKFCSWTADGIVFLMKKQRHLSAECFRKFDLNKTDLANPDCNISHTFTDSRNEFHDYMSAKPSW